MQLTIISTDQITKLEGVECRVWEGLTPDGIPCKAFVHRLAVSNDEDSSDFEAELAEQMPPGRVVSLRQVL